MGSFGCLIVVAVHVHVHHQEPAREFNPMFCQVPTWCKSNRFFRPDFKQHSFAPTTVGEGGVSVTLSGHILKFALPYFYSS